MINFLDNIRKDSSYYQQLSVDEQLITKYDCPLDQPKVELWSNQSYFVYVLEGRKIWHTREITEEVKAGQCLFVRKGGFIVEQFLDARFCVIIFFLTDRFIADTLAGFRGMLEPIKDGDIALPVINRVEADDSVHTFFQSVIPYFAKPAQISKYLLELKFRELILNVVGNPNNSAVSDYLLTLRVNSEMENLIRVMEENYCYSLTLEDYARLCNKSLSGFKRIFQEALHTTPGKWLLERRLRQARNLLQHSTDAVSDIAYQCGFENASHFSKAYKARFGVSPLKSRGCKIERLGKNPELLSKVR